MYGGYKHYSVYKDKAAFIIVKYNRSTTQQAVAQDSNTAGV